MSESINDHGQESNDELISSENKTVTNDANDDTSQLENVQLSIEKTLQLKEEGNSQFKSGQYDAAVDLYLKALQVCPEEEHTTRAILYANLAASKDHLQSYEEAIDFCNQALALNDHHTKALLRRAQLHKKCEKLDEAKSDYEQYLQLMPHDSAAQDALRKLTVQIDQRNEQLKTEMMSKLKDLGNMVLKPFGLSTNNFQMVKNPETGSYSINFQNNK